MTTHLFSDKRKPATPHPGYTTYAEIATDKLTENVRLLKQQAGLIDIMAVVKADAYGHGMSAMATFLANAGISHFLVATLDEALQLRTLLPEVQILVASPPHSKNLPVYAEKRLHASVTSASVAESVKAAAKNGVPLHVHAKIDTGMNRLGMDASLALPILQELIDCPNLHLDGIWSHLATAGSEDKTFAIQQIETAYQILEQLPDFQGYFHVGNSGTLLNHRDRIGRHPKELIRLGGALLGIPASQKLAQQFGLQPVMTLKSQVTHIKKLDVGDTVSYGRTWKATEPTQIAIVGAGYADGYPSALSGKGSVQINQQTYPIVGRVCMDMLMVDIGIDNSTINPGDEVILFGSNHANIYDLAITAGLVHYEICCRIPLRVPRRFTQSSQR